MLILFCVAAGARMGCLWGRMASVLKRLGTFPRPCAKCNIDPVLTVRVNIRFCAGGFRLVAKQLLPIPQSTISRGPCTPSSSPSTTTYVWGVWSRFGLLVRYPHI